MQTICGSVAEIIRHKGIVLSVNGDTVQVQITPSDACSTCAVRSACNGQSKAENGSRIIECRTQGKELHVGENVEVTLSRKMGWKAVLLAYILPFIVLAGTLTILDLSTANEALAGIIALCATGVYYIILSLFKPDGMMNLIVTDVAE